MKDIYNEFLKSSTQDEFTTEKVNVISNCLLGNYKENGEYVIPNNIVDELVSVKKVKKSVFKNSVFCGAFIVGYGEMVFEVTFQKNTVKNIAMSELFVLENEYKVNGYIQNTIRTRIASFTEKLEGFIENTYKHFNIVMSDVDDKSVKEYRAVDEVSEHLYINAKRNFNLNMAKLTKKDYNKLYKAYLTSRLELLKDLNNPYTLAILEKFNQEYAKIEKYFLQDQNYKAVSELLDKSIEDISNVNPLFAKQEQEFKDKCKPIIDEFSGKANDIAVKAHPKAMDELNKNDRVLNEELERELNSGNVAVKRDNVPVKEKATAEASSTSAASSVASSRTQDSTKPEKTTTESVKSTSEKAESTPQAEMLLDREDGEKAKDAWKKYFKEKINVGENDLTTKHEAKDGEKADKSNNGSGPKGQTEVEEHTKGRDETKDKVQTGNPSMINNGSQGSNNGTANRSMINEGPEGSDNGTNKRDVINNGSKESGNGFYNEGKSQDTRMESTMSRG